MEVKAHLRKGFGYRSEDVEEYVGKTSEEIDYLQKENKRITEESTRLIQSLYTVKRELKTLRQAEIQRSMEFSDLMEEAKARAEKIIEEAEKESERLKAEAKELVLKNQREIEESKAMMLKVKEVSEALKEYMGSIFRQIDGKTKECLTDISEIGKSRGL